MWMAKPCNQPQVPPIAFNHNTHTICHPHAITPRSIHNGAHAWLDGGAERLDDHSDDQHTMVSWQPLTSPTPLWCSTPSSNTSLLPSSWWCTGHTHATLCTTSGLESVVLCMPCVAIPLLSLLSTPLPFSLTLCVIGSHSVSNTFTSEQVTVNTRRRQCGWHTANKAHWLMHTSIHCDSRKALWLCVFVMMNDTHGMQWRINGVH